MLTHQRHQQNYQYGYLKSKPIFNIYMVQNSYKNERINQKSQFKGLIRLPRHLFRMQYQDYVIIKWREQIINNKLMLQNLVQPVKEEPLRLAAIKAKIDRKFQILYKMLNNIPILVKNDKDCQTDGTGIINPEKEEEFHLIGDTDHNKNPETLLTILKSENRSISMMSDRVSKQSNSASKNSKDSIQKIYSDNNSMNKSSGGSSTPKKQRIKSKISTKNTNYEKLIKQRQFQKQLQTSIKPLPHRQPVDIKKQTLQKLQALLQQKYKNDRNEEIFDNKTRTKLIKKVLQFQKQAAKTPA